MDKTISTVKKTDCMGCGACQVACPMDAIVMEYDDDGFLYPKLKSNCINCGKCSCVCQVLHPIEKYPTPKTYAFMATEEIRKISSSGGLFTILASYVIGKGGAVFGAVYSNDYRRVYMTVANSIEEVAPMRGSKYVFCETNNTYQEAKDILDSGRYVLYTGTPCEIAGLRTFLGREYENLILVDFICHGANSVKAYESWLDEITEGKDIEKLDFRDKNYFSWSTPAVAYLKDGTVKKQSHYDCFWYRGFLEGVINRDNCAHCDYACAERVSDITMGDAWQVGKINQNYNDGIGTSLVMVNSQKGETVFNAIQNELSENVTLCEEIPLDVIRKYNGSINFPQKQSSARKYFFSHLDEMGYHKSLWYGRGMRWDFGIVGWWFASNYGSALTYYALAKVLESMGKASIFIPIPKLDGTPWDEDTKIVENFIGKHFRIANKRDKDHMYEMNHFCDSFMLGSDQMWTEATTNLVGYTFFLDFVDANKKKIACAPSFGAGRFTNDLEIRFTARDYLNRFDAISVREESGVEICSSVFGIDAVQILDPIFWVDIEEYDALSLESTRTINNSNYLLCYVLDPSDSKLEIAKQIAEKNNLEIISILGMREAVYTRKRWQLGEVIDGVSVEDFVFYIKNAKYVFTDSHHGVCMSLKYNKDYVAIGNASRGLDRFYTIGNLLGVKNRIFSDDSDVQNILSLDSINYDVVNAKMEQEINRGENWLIKAMNASTNESEETVYTLLRRIKELEAIVYNR